MRNPGFSLKPEKQLGEPGSRQRNPVLAAVLYDLNLAETKGSGSVSCAACSGKRA
ncbi:hypothetical protein GCM10022421_13610 [Oceanisphaera sediminis]|uniref:Uncharacterized protein n=1 Tax=Oceanisphaera sediminis TaxID=981381 RepID=A0ABP7DN58_9GAMM